MTRNEKTLNLIFSSKEDNDSWNFETEYIDSDTGYVEDIFGDFSSKRFKSPNVFVRVTPSLDKGNEYPYVEIDTNDISYVDEFGYDITEDEFMNLADITPEELELMKAELIRYANGKIQDWFEENYDNLK